MHDNVSRPPVVHDMAETPVSANVLQICRYWNALDARTATRDTGFRRFHNQRSAGVIDRPAIGAGALPILFTFPPSQRRQTPPHSAKSDRPLEGHASRGLRPVRASQ